MWLLVFSFLCRFGLNSLTIFRLNCRYRGGSKYLKGKITRIRSSGAYDVLFNDGELEKRVDSTFIRQVVHVVIQVEVLIIMSWGRQSRFKGSTSRGVRQ